MKKETESSAQDPVTLPGKKKRHLRFLWISLIVVFSFCLLGILSLTPYALRTFWLPLAANLADAKMKASDLRVESILPLRVGVKDFHYSDGNGTAIDVESATTGIRFTKLFKGTIYLKDTSVSNMKLFLRDQPPAATASSVQSPEEKQSPPAREPLLVMRQLNVENVTVRLADTLNMVQEEWTIRGLHVDRFLPREKCNMEADAEIRTFPNPKNPLYINSLPIRMNVVFVLEDDYGLKNFHVDLKTGIIDLVLLNDYPIPAKVGIRLNLSADGEILSDDTFRLQNSELFLFKDKQSIGKLSLSGELGKKFRCNGILEDFNAGPILSFLVQDKKTELTIRRAEFKFEGHDFTTESLQSELIGELKLKTEAMSFPVDLDNKSRLFKLIMIPLEALPSFFNLARLKLDFKKEVNTCLASINEAVTGKKNLEFGKAEADIALDRGALNIRNISLQGKDIELESIQGTLDLPTGNLDIKSLIIFCGIKVPLNFEGTINKPNINLFSAVRDFLALNANFLKTLQEEFNSAPNPKDSDMEKAVKRGLRNLDKYLKQ